MAGRDRVPDEETPLLQARSSVKTPVPWKQINLILLALFAEPISSAYIFPFINQLIGELGITGGDDRKIGYYAGLIESLFFVTQALTSWQWSRLSDFVGRRPIILLGLLGLSLSNFAFGLSRTFAMLIISRCIAGMLNGNVGVMESVIGDITDHTNMAQVFALFPSIFCIGTLVAPLYGGILAKPQERWPGIFAGEFWATYPYFLPSFISGCFTLLIFLVCAVFLKESLPSKTGVKSQLETPTMVENSPDNTPEDDAQPIPMSTLIKTYSVMIPIANYGILALVEMGTLVLLPLFYASPIEIGGLGFPPSIIGMSVAIFGVVDGGIQVLFATRIIEWVGPKRLFSGAVLWFYPLIFIFPIMNAIVTAQRRVGIVVWILVALQLLSLAFMDLAYTVITVFVTRAAPNKQSLGSTNGLNQSLGAVARAIGPALSTSLFAVSKEYNILGGNLVYVILAILTTILVFLSRRLPELRDRE